MPNITNLGRFGAFYRNAASVFARTNLAPFRIQKPIGTSLYRYVAYRGSMPQAANAGRTQWLPLRDDLSNRWTGWGSSEVDSAQGLYFSNEFLDQNRPFPELDHYMRKDVDADAMTAYYKYRGGQEPQLQTAKASELRSMFLFTNNKLLTGLDLKLYSEPNRFNPLIEAILEEVRTNNPEVLEPGDGTISLYHSDGAEFCRAIGNACLNTVADIDYFETLSVRDGKSANTVMRAAPRTPLESVDPKGRATFFVNGESVGQGVYTVSDMIYNAIFEDDSVAGRAEMPTREDFKRLLTEVGRPLCDNMVLEYTDFLKDSPPNQKVEEVGQRIRDVQTSLANGDLVTAASAIEVAQTTIAALNIDGNHNLKAGELRALKMSRSVMGSLSEMARGAELAAEASEGNEDVDVDKIDIRDPEPDVVEPPVDGPRAQ